MVKNTSHDWLSYNYTTAWCSTDDNREISHFWWWVDHRLISMFSRITFMFQSAMKEFNFQPYLCGGTSGSINLENVTII